MVDALSDLDRVYAKWEGKNPYIANGKPDDLLSPRIDYNLMESKKPWNSKFGKQSSITNVALAPVKMLPGRTWGERSHDLMKIDPRLVSFKI